MQSLHRQRSGNMFAPSSEKSSMGDLFAPKTYDVTLRFPPRDSIFRTQVVADDYHHAQELVLRQYPGGKIGYLVEQRLQKKEQSTGQSSISESEAAAVSLLVVFALKILVLPIWWPLSGLRSGYRRREISGAISSFFLRASISISLIWFGSMYLERQGTAVGNANIASDRFQADGSSSNRNLVTPTEATGFVSGQTDRRAWESWVNSLSQDGRQGAIYWANERSKLQPGTCDGSLAFASACFGAMHRLSTIDQKRSDDPDYRRGWDSL